MGTTNNNDVEFHFKHLLIQLKKQSTSGIEVHGTSPEYLLNFVKYALANLSLPIDKLWRWAGYVYGVSSVLGLRTEVVKFSCTKSDQQWLPLYEATTRSFKRLLDVLEQHKTTDPILYKNLSISIDRTINSQNELSIECFSYRLGYVQGTMIALGVTTVDIERDGTRSFFHRAYELLGISKPASVDLST